MADCPEFGSLRRMQNRIMPVTFIPRKIACMSRRARGDLRKPFGTSNLETPPTTASIGCEPISHNYIDLFKTVSRRRSTESDPDVV